MRRLARLGCAAALAIASAAAVPSIANAHANYVKSNPAADARLVKPPTEVRVSFSEPPDPKSSEIQLLDQNRQRWDLGITTASEEPNGLKVGLKPIGDGGYTVAWSTVSAVDGHETKGSFAFVIGNGPLPSLPDIPNESPPPSPLEIAGRALAYAGIALAIGAALFGIVVHAGANATEERRERQLFALAAGLIVAGSGALVLSQGNRIPPRLELLLSIRLLAGLAIGATLAPALPAVLRRRAVLACGIVAALTATLVSHATALGDPKTMALDLIHVLAVSAWSGGVAAFLWTHLRSAQADAALARTAWRFSVLALTSVGVLVTAGVLQAFDRLVLIQDLWETPYGIALSAKGLLLVVILAVAAFNLLRYGPHGDRRSLLRGTAVEAALLAGVFVAAGVLTAFAPPAQPTGAAFDQTQHPESYRVELVVPTSTPGRNRFVLRVHQGLQPVTNAEKVALRFTMVEHDMGEAELVADERAPGEYVAIGSPTAMYGTWHVQAIIRLPGKEDVTALFTVPISPEAGQGATAIALTTKSFSLVVFPDPTLPIAGAPIELSVIALANGQPATGREVIGTVVSRDGQPVAAGDAFIAKEQGSGRYLIDIPALAAGKWTVRISIGGPGDTADYSFTVSP